MDVISQAMYAERPQSEIGRFFKGKNVFITGGTGFLGKVLVYKLLQSCPDIGTLYLLIRGKKGISPDNRLKDLLDTCPIFDGLRTDERVLKKVTAVDGDIMQPHLGLASIQRSDLVDLIHVIFHCAATVRFDEKVETAMKMNVHGAESLAKWAKEMPNLVSFVHVSTAYIHCYEKLLEEKLYPVEIDPLKKDEDTSPWPNSYTMSKATAEHRLAQLGSDLPLVIVRPSIVVGSLKEPIPGWVDNFNGPTGLYMAVATGFLRSMHVYADNTCDMVPVDCVVNMMCAAAYERGSRKFDAIPIFNCTTGRVNRNTWSNIQEHGFPQTIDYPCEKATMVWYPGLTLTPSRLWNLTLRVVCTWIPVLCGDLCLKLMGKKPMYTKIAKKLFNGIEALSYFHFNEWDFDNTNAMDLFHSMNEVDRDLFNFDLSEIDWAQCTRAALLGCRRYLLKQKDETIPESREHLKFLRNLDLGVKFIFSTVVLTLLCLFFNRLLQLY